MCQLCPPLPGGLLGEMNVSLGTLTRDPLGESNVCVCGLCPLAGSLLGEGKLKWGRYVSYIPPLLGDLLGGRKSRRAGWFGLEGQVVTSLVHSFGKEKSVLNFDRI